MKKIIVVLILAMSLGIFAQQPAQTNRLNISKVGFKLGLVKPSSVDSTLDFGLLLPLGNLYKSLNFATTVDYWSKDMGLGLDFSDLSLGLRMCQHFPQVKFLDKAKFFAGAGVAVHFAKLSTSTPIAVSETSTKLGLDAFGGFGYPLTEKLHLKTETGYRLVSDLSQLYLSATFIYKFR